MKNKDAKLIAEISANHCGSINHAKKLIHCAKVNKADAVKIQTYTADTMTIKSKKKILKFKKEFGKIITYGIYIKKLILLMNGMKNYLIIVKK